MSEEREIKPKYNRKERRRIKQTHDVHDIVPRMHQRDTNKKEGYQKTETNYV